MNIYYHCHYQYHNAIVSCYNIIAHYQSQIIIIQTITTKLLILGILHTMTWYRMFRITNSYYIPNC
jgi:hypothetical protein